MQNKLSLRARLLFILTCLFAMQLITACGSLSQSGNTSLPSTPSPVVRATPGMTATATKASTPTPIVRATPGTTGTTTVQEKITLTVAQTTYNASDTIIVTIANGLSQSIFVTPYYTSCTPVKLETEVQGNWTAVGKCVRGQVTHVVTLQAGSTTQLHLSPVANSSRPNVTSRWQTGTYRASLIYTTGTPDPDTYNPQGTVILSTPFSVV